jgi:cytochrome c551/c552
MKLKILILLFVFVPVILSANENGKQLFTKNCGACHKIGMRLVGPDLKNISEKREHDWLVNFIRSSQTMIKEGDELAIAIFNEYNQIPMPDQNLTDEEIDDILAYIKTESVPKEAVTPPVQTDNSSASSSGIENIIYTIVIIAMLLLIAVVALLGYTVKMLARASEAQKKA